MFLDRDGVVNRSIVRAGKPYPPASAADLEILPGVPEALALLRKVGYLNVVVTNQPDVAAGSQRIEEVELMHARLLRELPIDDIRVCYHVDADGCECRKPKPGMLLEAAQSHRIDLTLSFIVGDRWRDVLAGQRAGCSAFFIDYGYDERRPDPPYTPVVSLLDAARRIEKQVAVS